MPSADPTPSSDDFPAGQTGDMREVLLSPPTGAKPATAPAGRWEPPSAQELQKLLPQYEITALLGRGGMGAVYKGTQIALDRPVAIKILSNQLEEADASFAERFKNEAKAMAKLSHPGIVGVFDFGETASGLLYIVMEFIEGTDVSRMIARQGRLHTEHAMAITAHVCDALAYAHERGIIHRDIKPANIMVGYDGVVKVADFGLAKMTHTQNTGLTQSGMAMGTLHYMAPEALMLGSAVDHRADIYAVGVMLYQMLTGKIPQGLFELPSLQVPGLDPRYDGIIGKALREDRDLRYPSVLDMRHDLDAILTQPVVKVEATAEKAPAALQTQARPQRPGGQPFRSPKPEVIVRTERKSSPLLWTAVVALAVLAAWLYFKKPVPAGAPSAAVPAAANPPVADKSPAPAVKDPSTAITSNPAEATKDRPFMNSLGMKFVPVPGTKVLMCIHETRHKDYAAYAKANPSIDPTWKHQKHLNVELKERNEDHPVVNIGWQDAADFCSWLGAKEQKTYRLPTDHEWSMAVGIGNMENPSIKPEIKNGIIKAYPWGKGYPPPASAGNYSDGRRVTTSQILKAGNDVEYEDGYPTTAPVMSYASNPHGFFDLGGNVWEWCGDWYNREQTKRVLRGAAYNRADLSSLQSSYREHRDPIKDRRNDQGFRCVIALDEVPAATQKSAPPPAAAFVPTNGGWRSLLDERPDIFSTIRKPQHDDWGTMQLSYVPVPLVEAPNAAIRLRARNSLYLITRWSATATQGQHGFQVHVASSEGKSALIGGWITDVSNGTPNSFLPVQMPKLNFPPDQEYELELRAYGDRLTVLVNGKVEHEATNAALLGQWLAIKNASGPCYFKSLDWRPLDAQGNPKLTAPAPSTPVVSVTLPALPNPTTWTDTKGRSITATFKGIEGDKVMLVIAGKLTPVALNTLSAESQKLAQEHQQQQVAALFDAGTATNPAEATKAAPFINSLGMKFVPVPGTKVLFCIHETRCDDYAAYEAAVPRVDGSWKQKTIDGLPFSARRDHPVVNVNWDDAQAFCAWLSQKEGKRYRLPTDREWSHAVGIGQMEQVPNGTTPELIQMLAGIYPWGGGYPPKTSDQAGNYADMAWKELLRGQRCIDGYDDGFPATAPVMSYKANQLGLFDLGGNAQEWCEDWYDATRTKRVLRGSSWIKSPQSYLLSSYRDGFGPSRRNDSNGFRCVVELPAP